MTATGTVPCEPWDPIVCVAMPAAASAAVTGYAVQAASEVLWALSGRQFGLCSVTLRPCRRTCNGGGGWPGLDNWWDAGGGPRPVLFEGAWFNIACGSCPGGCSCTPLEETILPGPVHTVTEVKLNGSVMVTGSQYRVDEHRLLVRTDGGTWPLCQDMTAPDTADDTWSVTALYGQEVPASGRFAVGELAAEFAKGCVGASCALPSSVSQIARQGVTVDFTQFAEIIKEGLIGLRFCDLFISAMNPNHLPSRPQVYDVDGPMFRRTNT